MPNIRPESRHGFAHDYFNDTPNNQPVTLSAADTNALDWMRHGNCHPPHPDWVLEQIATVPDATTITAVFFPEPGQGGTIQARAMKTICNNCPVQAECLDYGLAHPETRGAWGGLSENQLKAERAHRNRQRRDTRPAASHDDSIAHGTERGYHQHIRRGEQACPGCIRARNTKVRERRNSKGAA